MQSPPPQSKNNIRYFAFTLLITQLILIIIYGIFVRPLSYDDNFNIFTDDYPVYQNLNAMVLIGFGFAMAFIKSHSWASISYTFFINAIVIQLYIVWNAFWDKILNGNDQLYVNIKERDFTDTQYSIIAIMISFCGILGRVGPFRLLILALIQIIGFTLNRQLLYFTLGVFDVGGTIARHIFGSFCGITVSLILSKAAVKPKEKPQTSYNSNIFAILGTLFLWMYWPTANSSHLSNQPYFKGVIIINTILSMSGSCIATFITGALVRGKFAMSDICNATLAGGVIISSACGIFVNPTASLCVGFFAGIISTLSFKYLQPKFQEWIGLDDTCGILSLHAIPGLMGGIMSAIAIAVYTSDPLTNALQIQKLPFYPQNGTNTNLYGRTFYQQGGIQMAGTFIAMGMGIGFGIVAGLLMRISYSLDPQDLYKDFRYFQQLAGDEQQYIRKRKLTQSMDMFSLNNTKIMNQPTVKNIATIPTLKREI